MMHISISIYFVSLLVSVHGAAEDYSAIAEKVNFKNPAPIALDAPSYLELVKNSNVFVDKSLFLKYIFTFYESSILITYPEKWGKSINLDMVKSFFQIELDNEGNPLHPIRSPGRRLFHFGEVLLENEHVVWLKKPLFISKHKSYVKDYQGKYPVIYINMGNITGTSYDQIIDTMCVRIKETFQRHSYMRHLLVRAIHEEEVDEEKRFEVETILEKFDSFLNGQSDTNSLTESLIFLAEILRSHFDQKVFILIDNYDGIFRALIKAVFPERHERDILSFYSSFLTKTLVNNVYLEKAILTGTFQILSLFPSLNETKAYNISDIRLYRYFGFTKLEVDTMLKLLSIREDLSERSFHWYSGYQCGVKSSMKLYNSRSISNFICNQKIDNYFAKMPNADDLFIGNALQHKRFRGIMVGLVIGKMYNPRFLHIGHTKLYYHRHDFNDLTENTKVVHRPFRLFLTYLHATGYIALKRNITHVQCFLQIPNNDIRTHISDKLMNFYMNKYPISLTTINDIVNHLATFIDSNDTTSEPLTLALQSFFDTFPIYNDTYDTELMTFLLHYFATRVTIAQDYWIDNPPQSTKAKPDVIFYTLQRQVIIKGRLFSTSIETILEQVKNYQILQPFEDIKLTRVIAIGISPDKRVSLLADCQPTFEDVAKVSLSPSTFFGEESDAGIEPSL